MSLFWKNLEICRKKAKRERKDIEIECKLANNAFTQGIKRASSPSVDLAYQLAKAVGTTIEELVDGENGAKYVRKVVQNDPLAIQVPERISTIVKYLLVLNEGDLIGIEANAEALAKNKRGKTEKAAGMERRKKAT